MNSVRPTSKLEQEIGIPRSTKAVHDFCELPLQEILEMLYRESRTNEQELQLVTFQVPCDLLNAKSPAHPVENAQAGVSLQLR